MYYFFRKDSKEFIYAKHDDEKHGDEIVIKGDSDLEKHAPYLKIDQGSVVKMTDEEIRKLRLVRVRDRAIRDINSITEWSIKKKSINYKDKNFSLSEHAQANWLRRAYLAKQDSSATFDVTTTDDQTAHFTSDEVTEIIKEIDQFIEGELNTARTNKQIVKAKKTTEEIIDHMIANDYIKEEFKESWEKY